MIKNIKLLSLLLTLTVILTMNFSAFAAKADITIKLQIGNPMMTVNGMEQPIDENGTVPIVQNDRTLLPVRAVVEAMDGSVEWDSTTETVTLTCGNDVIRLTIGSETAYLNGTAQNLDVAPALINERTMLPIRFVAESFGFDVDWDDATQTVTITHLSENVPEIETKTLVVYFSHPETTDPNNMTTEEENSAVVIDGEVLGNTQYVAYVIQENTGADIFRIEPKIPYTTDHKVLVDLAKEEQNQKARPELAANVPNLEQYDVIFLGYPNWWGDLPMILYSFLETHDFSGKTIIPFNTHGGSGFSNTISTIAELQPNAAVNKDGFTVSRNNVQDTKSDIIDWLKTLNLSTNKTAAEFNLKNGTAILNNGVEMPVLGLGTYRLTDEEAENSVYHALTFGYKLIDTAAAYRNEEAVGRGIKKSGVPREDVFITTKLWPNDYANAAAAIDTALEKLDVEYIDLLLLHQPWGDDFINAYQAMEVAVAQGKVRAIGLSNVYQKNFDKIIEIAKIPPAVLQNERNPYFQQAEMMEYIAPYGTVMMDWFPLGGRGDNVVPSERQQSLFDNEVILEIAEAHEKTAAQIILRWHIQSGGIAIPGSRNPDHILENITIFDFELTEEEMQKIAALETDIPSFDFRDVTEQPNFESFVPPAGSNVQE